MEKLNNNKNAEDHTQQCDRRSTCFAYTGTIFCFWSLKFFFTIFQFEKVFFSLAFGNGETYPYDPEHGTGSNSTELDGNIDIGT